jgi:DNA polymerase-3 subunit alpha
MYANVENLLAFNKEHIAGKEANQDSLFGGMATAVNQLVMKESPDVPKEQKLLWEKELLGVYVSGHPLDAFKNEIESRTTITQIKNDGRNGIPVVTAGMIESVRELLTKKGDRMAFIQLSNLEDTIEMVAFPEVFQTNKDLLVPGTCVAVKGKLSIRNEQPSVMVDRLKNLISSL